MIADNTRYLWVQSASAAMREDNARGGMAGMGSLCGGRCGDAGWGGCDGLVPSWADGMGDAVMDLWRDGLMV